MDLKDIFAQVDQHDVAKQEVEAFKLMMKEYEMGLLEIKSDLEIIDLEWRATNGYSPFEHVKTRIKTPLSLRKKMEKKNVDFKPEAIRENIFDIIGVRIVTTFEEDVYSIYELLKNRDDLKIKRVKDYIKHPKASGYKSLHLIVETQLYMSKGVKWIPLEIQIRTLAMDFFAAAEHKLQYKYSEIDKNLKKELFRISEIAGQLDEKMGEVRKAILPPDK